jgi:hypothetical protein
MQQIIEQILVGLMIYGSHALHMSLPRRAMEQMGFAVCCLMCDAGDVAGSNRCRYCIDSHVKSRDKLNTRLPKTKADRLAREFITMLTEPSKYIDDSDHGDSMLYYSKLVDKHNGIVPAKTSEDVKKIFEMQRKIKPKSLIRDVANQNKWVEEPPNGIEREKLLKLITQDSVLSGSLDWDNILDGVDELLDNQDI